METQINQGLQTLHTLMERYRQAWAIQTDLATHLQHIMTHLNHNPHITRHLFQTNPHSTLNFFIWVANHNHFQEVRSEA